jgi:hypothetical protein
MILHVVYDKDGDKVGDSDSMNYALDKLNRIKGTEQELQVNIANSLVIYAFRVLVKEGKIKPYTELFLYNKSTDPDLKHPIKVDKNGEQESYPLGMCDEYSNILMKLL